MLIKRKDSNDLQKSWPWWRWVLIILNLMALVLSVILSWHYLRGGSMAGCGGGSPCEQVLNSKWSMIAGVLPVSSLAVGIYLSLLVAGFFIGPATEPSIRRLAWRVMLVLAGSIAGSAIWFTIIQKWIIGNFCFYCMTTHITGFLIAALVIWRSINESDDQSNKIKMKSSTSVENISPAQQGRIIRFLPAIGFTLCGIMFAGLLATSQVIITPKSQYIEGESKNNLPVIDYHVSPMVGSPDASYIVTLLFDYQCPHCQQLHLMLDEVVRRYNGKLAFALCPSPLNNDCNPYIPESVDDYKSSCELARISLAVWIADREAFHSFDNWMYSFESGDIWHPRSIEAAKAKAIGLIGQAKFETSLANPWIGQYTHACTQIYGKTVEGGKGGVPKLVFNSNWVIPEPNNIDDLISILQKSLSVPMP